MKPVTTLFIASALLALRGLGAPSPSAPTFDPTVPSARSDVLDAMARRPKDPWPRSEGHVILGLPGSYEEFKGYHEPGGNFSPGFGSFGVSFWVTDAEDRTLVTSDTLAPSEIVQRLVWDDKPSWPSRPDLPGILTRTPYYDSVWRVTGMGRWDLEVTPRGTNPVWMVIRSVGPAGAPLGAFNLTGNQLFVSDRWLLTFSAHVLASDIVQPRGAAHSSERPAKVSWPAERDWGYARFKLREHIPYLIHFDDTRLITPSPLRFKRGRALVDVDLPDPEFAECLDAQVAHLLMGLVWNETRPGDPNHYPLNWLRDGSQVISALARAGQIEVASDLSLPFAEKDFFGGFGSEADAPGLALWALEEVASRLKNRKFDALLWPHVERKAALIEEMLTTKEPIRRPFEGPIVPAYASRPDLDLVAQPARDGLIVGRMDWHEPVLYVNAVSYRGLLSAAELAVRLNKLRSADRWRTTAADLRLAWNKALATPAAQNDRTYIAGLFPTWVVEDRDLYAQQLAARRTISHEGTDQIKGTPLWTYFNLAEAQQWLNLGEPKAAWNDLRWFLGNQASTGLYTWWEGSGEENSFHRWETVRGWVRPPHVTPHYWSAAAMLDLQLSMLAFLDESPVDPVLVVGAGIPAKWLSSPMHARGLSTRQGTVDWEWRKGRMTVWVHGLACQVKLGASFPQGTPVRIKR